MHRLNQRNIIEVSMKINLDMQTLRSFIKVAEMSSFTNAADALHLTQPAISQQIKRLEELLDANLFDRENRIVRLTSVGEKFLQYATDIVNLNDTASEVFHKTQRKEIIHIGMPEHYSDLVLPRVIGEIHDFFPDVQLIVKIARAAVIAEQLNSGKLDLGIIIEQQKIPHISDDNEIAVKWLISENTKLSISKDIPLVLFRSPCVFRNLAIKHLEENGFSWRCVYESEDLISLRSAVIADIGVTILPYLRKMPGLREIGTSNVLPPLPQFRVTLRQRDGWDYKLKQTLTSRILNIWTTFQTEAR
jgi:DNA-binding transcriptional LysR family regulator